MLQALLQGPAVREQLHQQEGDLSERSRVRVLRWAAGLIAALAAFALPAFARQPVVTDGDTIKLNGAIYRLHGIDAPETKQDCPDGWPAGRLATTHLQALISGRSVICERKDTDRYGRTVAICRAGGEDLGALMVRDGYAWAFTRYSDRYVYQETQAKTAQLGVHRHECAPAWEWRAARAKGLERSRASGGVNGPM